MESIVLEACHPLDPSYRAIQTTLRGNLEDVRRRNEAMLFKTFPPLVSLTVGAAVGDIEVIPVHTCWRRLIPLSLAAQLH